ELSRRQRTHRTLAGATRVLRGRRAADRLFTDVRPRRGGAGRAAAADTGGKNALLGHQRMDARSGHGRAADGALTAVVGAATLRPDAGAQPARLEGAPAYAQAHEGRRGGAPHRHHHLARTTSRRVRDPDTA